MRKYLIAALATGFTLGAILFSATPVSAQVAGSVWKLTANYLYPVNSLWGVAVPSLANLNCIGTNSSGVFGLGTCGGGSGGSGTVSTSSPGLTSGQPVYATGVNTIASVASSTFLTSIGGQAALSLPLSIANGGTATSSAVTNGVYYYNGTNAEADSLLTFNNSTKILTTSALTLSALTGTQCLHEISGVVSGTGSDCGSGGGGTVGSGTTGQFPYYAANGTTLTATSSLFLATNGNIGIGTTSPSQLLTVGNNNQFTLSNSGIMVMSNGSGGATMTISPPNGNVGSIQVNSQQLLGISKFNILSMTSGGEFGWTSGTGNITNNPDTGISRGAAGKLYVGNGTSGDYTGTLVAGNIGIGTTTPLALLNLFAGGSYASQPASTLFAVGSSTAGTATTTLFDILSGGNVGIGSTTPGSLLSIGNTNGINFSTGTSTFSSTGGINLAAGCFAIAGTCIGSGGSGTVTSVGLSDSNSTLTIGSTPVTTSGTITATLNLAHSNAWSVLQSFTNASTSRASFTGTSWFGGTATTTINADGLGSIKISGTGNITDTPLATAAGTFIAADANGKLIATTTPTGSNFFTNSSIYTYLSTGTNLGIGTTTPGSLLTIQNAPASTQNPFSIIVASSSPYSVTFTTGGTWTVPATLTSVSITCIGAGGGGATYAGGSNGGGGGGGGSTAVGSLCIATGGGGGSPADTGSGGTVAAGGDGSGGAGGTKTGGSSGNGGGGGAQVVATPSTSGLSASYTVTIGQGGQGAQVSGGGGTGGTGLQSGGTGSTGNPANGGGGGGSTGAGQSGPAGGAGGTGASTGGTVTDGGSSTLNSGGNTGTAGGNSGSGATGGTAGAGGAGGNGNTYGAGGGGGGGVSAGNGGNGAQGEVIITGTLTSGQTGMSIDQFGHLITGGQAPTCGTGCSSVQGDDRTMRVLTGSSVSSVTVNFANAWNTAPICIPTDMSGVSTGVEASTTATTVVLSLSTALTTKFIGVTCQTSANFTF